MPLQFVELSMFDIKLMALCSSLQTQSQEVKPCGKAKICGLPSSTKPFKITPILPKYSHYVHNITCFTSNQPRSLTSALYLQKHA